MPHRCLPRLQLRWFRIRLLCLDTQNNNNSYCSGSFRVIAKRANAPRLSPYTKTSSTLPSRGLLRYLYPTPAGDTNHPYPQTKITLATKNPKFPFRSYRHGDTVTAMRTNPQPASGPVSIKHVRNTVPKKPASPTTSAVSVPTKNS